MLKELETNDGRLFVIDNNTGKWGITSQSKKDELKEHLKKMKRPVKNYDGTSLLVINSSNTCNLDCVYCSETKHRGVTDSMSLDVAKSVVDKALEEEHPPQIIFHGSEPSQNWNWIKSVVNYGEQRSGPDKRLRFSLQSNLAQLPDDFFSYVNKHEIGVSTSIDGTREIHDKTRPYLGGGSSFNDIIGNARQLLKQQGGLNVITVVNKYNVDHLQEIKHLFEGEGFTEWQTLPAENMEDVSPNPKKFGEAYIGLFDETLRRIEEGDQKMKVKALSQYLGSMFITKGTDACRVCSSGTYHPLLAVDSGGEVYPCDFFWGQKDAIIGSIEEGVLSLSKNQKNIRYRNIDDTICEPCAWKMNCGGGCLASAYFSEKNKIPYCVSNNMVYTHLARRMPEFIEKGLVKKVLEWTSR